MRFAILVLLPTAVLAACRGGGGEPGATLSPSPAAAPASPTPTAAASPGAPGEVDVRDLLLRADEVPTALARLGEPFVATGDEFAEDYLGPDAEGDVTQKQVKAWEVIGVAAFYAAPPTGSGTAADLFAMQVTLSETEGGAAAFLSYNTNAIEGAIETEETDQGRDVLTLMEVSEPVVGQDSATFYYVSEDRDNGIRFEGYVVFFRRDRAVALIQVQAPEGNVTLEQVTGLAEKLDGRIQEGLQ
ncbi:MAG: hypothetical protein HYS09_10545 [Chloroflexi bacterium]|nr:hypothetical protein [Chloroflexota bacterium]